MTYLKKILKNEQIKFNASGKTKWRANQRNRKQIIEKT